MKVLLLGSTGMAGQALNKTLSKRGYEVIGVTRSGADISCDLTDEAQVQSLLRDHVYDAIVNAAAQVDVSRCDRDPLESWMINGKLVSLLANFSHCHDVPLLHISTDHYYPYGDDAPHTEFDPVICVNEYARHKYAAETFALASHQALVLRTSILGERQKGQQSLVEWAVSSLRQDVPMTLFHDAWTSSMDVGSFSESACDLFFEVQHRGLLNVGSKTVYSKETLIRTLAEMLSLDTAQCRSESIKTVSSNRPNCLGLNVAQAETVLGYDMPTMEIVCQSLIDALKLHRPNEDSVWNRK